MSEVDDFALYERLQAGLPADPQWDAETRQRFLALAQETDEIVSALQTPIADELYAARLRRALRLRPRRVLPWASAAAVMLACASLWWVWRPAQLPGSDRHAMLQLAQALNAQAQWLVLASNEPDSPELAPLAQSLLDNQAAVCALAAKQKHTALLMHCQSMDPLLKAIALGHSNALMPAADADLAFRAKTLALHFSARTPPSTEYTQ